MALTSPISFLAPANCIAFCGGTPDFVDIDPATLCLTPEVVEAYCLKNKTPRHLKMGGILWMRLSGTERR